MSQERKGSSLSNNGKSRLEAGKILERVEMIASNAYRPDSNPDGIINLALAENTLLYKELGDYFKNHFQITYADFPNDVTRARTLRTAIAGHLNTYFGSHEPVTPNHIVVGSGLIPILAHLAGTLADRGEGILVASPYFHGFDLVLPILNGVVPVGVSVPSGDMFSTAELAHLEKALHKSNENGVKIRGVILCNPHNPWGRAYPQEAVIEYCKFCEKHDLHLISDEVYALSIFPSRDVPNPEPFVSTLSFNLKVHGIDPSRLHVLYGMSKDFNTSGFRLGALISQHNQALIRSMTVSSFFMTTSSPANSLWATLLNDKEYLPHFISMNRLKLQEAYEHTTSWLKFHDIPYNPTSAGHFLLVDLRPALSDMVRYGSALPINAEQDMHARATVLEQFIVEHGVLILHGAASHMKSGWFRITFSVRRDFLDVALARIEDALCWKRWPGLLQNTATLGSISDVVRTWQDQIKH